MFVLKHQVQDLRSKYDSNDYNTIDSVETQNKENWKSLICELASKKLITMEQRTQINNQIDAACTLGITGGSRCNWSMGFECACSDFCNTSGQQNN